MNLITAEALYELTENILLPLVISTAATLVHVSRSGWHGIRDFFAKWTVSIFCGVMAHWAVAHYGITGAMSAVIISMAALFSHQIMDLLFSTQIKDAIKKRLLREIETRGADRNQAGGDGD